MRRHDRGRPDRLVVTDCRIDVEVEDPQPLGPDVAVIEAVTPDGHVGRSIFATTK